MGIVYSAYLIVGFKVQIIIAGLVIQIVSHVIILLVIHAQLIIINILDNAIHVHNQTAFCISQILINAKNVMLDMVLILSWIPIPANLVILHVKIVAKM